MCGQFGVNFLRQLHRLAVRRDSQRRDANLIRRDAQRPDDAVLVVALLDDRLQRARDADAVAAHDRRLARAGLVQKRRVQLLAVFRAELEHVADFNRAADFQRLAAFRAGFAGGDGAQIKPIRHLDVALDGDVAQMETILVRAGGHAVRAAQTFIGKNLARSVGHIRHSAKRTRVRAERGNTFFRRRRTEHRAVPIFAMNLVSFNWSSPRIKMMTGLLSAM